MVYMVYHLALMLLYLSTLCHGCGFDYQQKVIKMFPGPDCVHSKDGIV